MTLKLYRLEVSPASRSVMMVCDILKLPVQYVDVNYITNEHLTENYKKKNPLHTIPVLEDGDLTLHDSHVILTYLIEKYAQDDTLYPKDIKQRAMVDQKLYFDTLLFTRMRNITGPAITAGVKKPPTKLINELIEVYTFTEEFLKGTKYMAGDRMTAADICAVATISSIDIIIPVDAKTYPKTNAWLKLMEEKPFYKNQNTPGLICLRKLLADYLDLQTMS